MENKIVVRPECLEAIKKFSKDRNKDNMVAVMTQVENDSFLVAVNATIEMTEEMIAQGEKTGKFAVPNGTSFQCKLLKSDQGDMILPIFTTVDEVTNLDLKKQIMLMPFFEIAKAAVNSGDMIKAAVINPFSDNVGIVLPLLQAAVNRREAIKNAKKLQADGKEVREVKLTKAQFELAIRNQLELRNIPKAFYADRDSFLENVYDKKGDFFRDMYVKAFGEQMECPYSEDEFSVMVLNLRADFQMVCVDLPTKKIQNSACAKLYMTWNQTTNEINYFVIQKTEEGRNFAKVDADGKYIVIGDAPSEGSEMNTIMDYLEMND